MPVGTLPGGLIAKAYNKQTNINHKQTSKQQRVQKGHTLISIILIVASCQLNHIMLYFHDR